MCSAPDSQRFRCARPGLDADGCWSGEIRNFFGVEFVNGNDIRKRIRLVDDPVLGHRVVLLDVIEGMDRVVLDSHAYSKFEVHLEKTHSTMNDIRTMKAKFDITCDVPRLGLIVASGGADECAFDNRPFQL